MPTLSFPANLSTDAAVHGGAGTPRGRRRLVVRGL